jgi:hypothetical protein
MARSSARSSVSSPLARSRCSGSGGSWRVERTSRRLAGAARNSCSIAAQISGLRMLWKSSTTTTSGSSSSAKAVQQLDDERRRRAAARPGEPPQAGARRRDAVDGGEPLRPESRLGQLRARCEPRDLTRVSGEPRGEQ